MPDARERVQQTYNPTPDARLRRPLPEARDAGQIVRTAPTLGSVEHPHSAEPRAELKAFRHWLREQAHTAGPQSIAGVAGRASRCPIAVWLRRARGYRHVSVRAGDTQPCPHGRVATFHASDKRGRPLGGGACDIGLTLVIDWLDGVAPEGAVLTVGDVLEQIEMMERVWPPTFAAPLSVGGDA
jgi:hypothetical protein